MIRRFLIGAWLSQTQTPGHLVDDRTNELVGAARQANVTLDTRAVRAAPPAFGRSWFALLGMGLALPGACATLWRTFFAQPFLPSDEQLNLATFIVARQQPAYLASDFAYASSDPSRFYTPLQIALVDALWGITGSVEGAVLAQAIPLVAATLILATTAVYWLTGKLLPAVAVGVAALNYREIPSSVDIWGLGPSLTLLPRAWAAPLVFWVVALWLRASLGKSLRHFVICGLLAGVVTNIHPPTGIPLTLAVLVASGARVAVGRGTWRELTAIGIASTVGVLPFVAPYLSVTSVAASVDYEAFMTAARLRVDHVILPQVLQTLTLSLRPDSTDFRVNAALIFCAAIAFIPVSAHATWRRYCHLLLGLAVAVVIASVVVPLAAQVVLMGSGWSPIATTDFFRGLRLIVPIAMVISALGMAAGLNTANWRGALVPAIAALLILDSSTAYAPRTPAVWLLVVAVAGGTTYLVASRLRGAHPGPMIPTVLLGALLILQPAAGMLVARHPGPFCCTVPERPQSARAVDELVTWIRSRAEGSLLETSAMEDYASLRLRLETRHGATFIPKDGNVLLYSDPVRAVEWGRRAVLAHDIVSSRDFEGLRRVARARGASLVLVDRVLWPGAVSGGTPLFQNSRFAVFSPEGDR